MSEPIEINGGVTIQMSGAIPLPTKYISLNAMTDADNENCDFTLTSFAMTEEEARTQLNQFLQAIIAKLQSELGGKTLAEERREAQEQRRLRRGKGL